MTRYAILCVALIAVVGCGPKSAPLPKSASGFKKVPDYPALKKTETTKGTGHVAQIGDIVYLEYVGNLSDGTEFDTSKRRINQHPYTVRIGDKAVIAGWDEGLVGVQAGGVYHLEIPSAKGYGALGSLPIIPPSAGLQFDLTILKVAPQSEENVVRVKDLKVGTGAVATSGSRISIHYVGKYVNGVQFDDSRKRNEAPDSFLVGAGKTIPGIEKGIIGSGAIAGMREGGQRRITVPALLAWGDPGFSPIPPLQTLVFTVDLVKVESGS